MTTYGGPYNDRAFDVLALEDGGYILVGSQADEEPTRFFYESNIYLIKTDAEGNEIWPRLYGDQVLYLGWAVAQTADGGYVLAGWGASTCEPTSSDSNRALPSARCQEGWGVV